MKTIEVLGTKGHEKTKQLRVNIAQALQAIGLDIELKETHQVDVSLATELDAIPALKVDGQLVLQQTIPTVKQLKVLLKMLLAPAKSSLQLKRLLIPTDFSDSAQNAYQFALNMVRTVGAQIQLVHYYQSELDPVYPYFGSSSFSFLQQLKKQLEGASQNTGWPQGLIDKSQLEVNTALVEGFVETALPKLATDQDTDIIVMGTTGAGGLLNKWIGTVSSTLVQKATCPTLLIPKGVQFKGFNNILFASDFQANDEAIIQQLLDFAALYEAHLHFVHVADSSDSDSSLDPISIESTFRENAPNSTFTMVTLKSNSPLDAIHQYSKENKIDLVALAALKRGVIAKLFHKSMTKQLVFNSEIPLMVLPMDY